MLRVQLFVQLHHFILVYYVFPQLVKCVLFHYLIDHLCLLFKYSITFDAFKKSQDTSLFKVLCKLILMIYILFV